VIRGSNAFVLDARLKTAGVKPAARKDRGSLVSRRVPTVASHPSTGTRRALAAKRRLHPGRAAGFFQSVFFPDRVFSEQGIVRIADLGQGAFSREFSKFFKTVFENARALAPAIFLWRGPLF
jgi:hypothetical protein